MAVSIKKLDEKNNVSRYIVKGVSPAFLNSVRRAMMSYTNNLAVEDLAIYENDSVLFDEFLAHRLGMLPLKCDSKSYKKGDKVKLVLEKEGPCTVYSKDIKSTDPKIEPVDKNVPITKLEKGQRIKVEMEALMESGQRHAKWQPAIVAYKEIPALLTSKDCNACEECVKACPKGIIEVKGKKVTMARPEECILCESCVEACKKNALQLDFSDQGFIFMVEPISGMTPSQVVENAVKELSDKISKFGKEIKKAK